MFFNSSSTKEAFGNCGKTPEDGEVVLIFLIGTITTFFLATKVIAEVTNIPATIAVCATTANPLCTATMRTD